MCSTTPVGPVHSSPVSLLDARAFVWNEKKLNYGRFLKKYVIYILKCIIFRKFRTINYRTKINSHNCSFYCVGRFFNVIVRYGTVILFF